MQCNRAAWVQRGRIGVRSRSAGGASNEPKRARNRRARLAILLPASAPPRAMRGMGSHHARRRGATRPGLPPSSPRPEDAVRCPLLERDLERWVRRCTCRFLPLARRVAGDDDDVRDALQQSWIIVLEKLHQYRGESPACGWVGSIVRHEALHAAAARGRDVSLSPPATAREVRPRSGRSRPDPSGTLPKPRRIPREFEPSAAGGHRRVAADLPRGRAAAGRRGSADRRGRPPAAHLREKRQGPPAPRAPVAAPSAPAPSLRPPFRPPPRSLAEKSVTLRPSNSL